MGWNAGFTCKTIKSDYHERWGFTVESGNEPVEKPKIKRPFFCAVYLLRLYHSVWPGRLSRCSKYSTLIPVLLLNPLSRISSSCIPVPVYLQEVMDRAVEEPLDIHLPFAPESKSIEPQGGADVGKDRFRGSQSFVIDETTFHRIDLPFHLLGKALGEGWGTSLEEVNLPCFGTVGIS
jgi:hypothetical protein